MANAQHNLLRVIRVRLLQDGGFPTVREIQAELGYQSTGTVHKHLTSLVKSGMIDHEPCVGYSANERTLGESCTIPVLGKIAAGHPIEAVSQNECIDLLALVGDGRFSLIASGDSMRDAGIQNEDFLIFDSHYPAQPGDIVAALIRGEETTVKTFARQGDRILLKPENPAYNDQIYDAQDVTIQGVLIGTIRIRATTR